MTSLDKMRKELKERFDLIKSNNSDAKIFYHVTTRENMPSIMKEGLVPRITQVQLEEALLAGFKPYPHINLWDTLENVRLFMQWGWGPVILEVNLPADFVIEEREPIPKEVTATLGFKGFTYRTTKTIPPEYLKEITIESL